MPYAIIGLSTLFVLIGLIITENNAKYLLSGYNMMSEEDREKVDIKSYIPRFKKFHFVLGVSFLFFGLSINYFIGENATGVFMGLYPIAAYIFWIWKNGKYTIGVSNQYKKVIIYFLIILLIFISGLFYVGFDEDRLIINEQGVQLEGIYGETLKPQQIKTIKLTSQLPKIKYKSNGFALGEIKKGYFITSEKTRVKFLLNSLNQPYIQLTRTDGKEIYFSAKNESNKKIYNDLRQALPEPLFQK
ncbi:MAG: DUF3784 domain-containing protein [Cyclobacteriaceae bacterium]